MAARDGGGRLNILVIDDDELVRLAVRRCLQQSAIDSRSDPVGSAAEALQRDLSGYDCILLDYYLPGEDGIEALKRLRDAAPRVPVVIFTGRGDEDIAVELMKAGAADYLPKASLTPERLEAAVRHALRVLRAAEARERAERLLRLLSDAAEHVLTAGDPDELLHGLWQRIREPLGVDAWFNFTLDRPGVPPRLVAYGGIAPEVASSLARSAAACATDLATIREPVQLDLVRPSGDPRVRTLKEDGIRACVCHPLLAGGVRLGTLCFATRGKDEFAPDELDFLRTVSRYATSAYERLKHIEVMREADRRKDEFLATLAHELRDPLAPLVNVAELMKRTAHGDEALERARHTMDRQLRQLVQLVDDLLDVARITRGQLKLRKRRVALAPALHQAIEMVTPLVDAAGQVLEVTIPDDDIWLDADPVRLTQVFGNLLTNASKFSGPEGRIRLSAERGDGVAVVRVADTGIGIPPGKLDSIFEMFMQVPDVRERSHKGLGIGLTLASRLLEMHGASIEARSEGPGKGSEFVVRLPTADAAGRSRRAAAAGEAAAVEGRRILIVDDNRDSANSLAVLLELAGHETRQAYDGPQALVAAGEFRPDVVLLDIGLPGLDGYAVCQRLRGEPWGRELLIVALSGWGQAEDRARSKAAGFDHHMVKPVKHEVLTALLGQCAASQREAAR